MLPHHRPVTPGILHGRNDEERAATTTATAAIEPAVETVEPTEEPAPEPEPAVGPKAQQAFLAAVADSSAAYDEASTELKKTKVLHARDAAACNATGREFANWEGTITKIGSNDDGQAHVATMVGDDVEIATWNNAFSDMFDETLHAQR